MLSATACHVQWNTYTPEASFETVCNSKQHAFMIMQQGGPEALMQREGLDLASAATVSISTCLERARVPHAVEHLHAGGQL